MTEDNGEEIKSSFDLFKQTVGPKGEQPADGMVPFEEKTYLSDDDTVEKGIFVDGTLFDWGVDEEDYERAKALGPKYQQAVEASIAKHFVSSFSEFMGREVTLDEVNEARKIGWIMKPITWI